MYSAIIINDMVCVDNSFNKYCKLMRKYGISSERDVADFREVNSVYRSYKSEPYAGKKQLIEFRNEMLKTLKLDTYGIKYNSN